MAALKRVQYLSLKYATSFLFELGQSLLDPLGIKENHSADFEERYNFALTPVT